MALGAAIRSAASTFGPSGLAAGAGGLLMVGGYAFAGYSAYSMYGEKYGAGGATAFGLAEAAMFNALPIAPGIAAAGMIYGIPAALEYGKDVYRTNRKVNLGKPIHDPYGTAATMRQRSASVMSRGRTSLGAEARLYHY